MAIDRECPFMGVVANQEDVTFVEQVATALGYTSAHIVPSGLAAAVEDIKHRSSSPKYLLIDIGEQNSDTLDQIDALAEYCNADTAAVVIGSINDVSFYRELLQRGVVEYFTRPAKISDVRSALISAGQDKKVAGSGVISFMSAASGDGSSSVALNVAHSLAHEYGKPTVIVDMDFQFGMVARSLDLNSPFGIRELFEHPDRTIDSTLVDRMLVPYGENLHVIAAPHDLRVWPEISPDMIRNLISTLREKFEYVVIDVPHVWSPWLAAALSASDLTIMVAQLWLRSVTHTSRLLGVWRDAGIEDDEIYVIINRSGAKFKEAVTRKDYEMISSRQVDFFLANDIRTVASAENQGKTIAEIGNSLLAKQFHELTGQLIAKHRGEPITQNQEESTAMGEKSPLSAISSVFSKK